MSRIDRGTALTSALQALHEAGDDDLARTIVAMWAPLKRPEFPGHKHKRFIVFGFDQYESGGGLHDIQESFDTLEEAHAYITPVGDRNRTWDYMEIVDRNTWETLVEFERERWTFEMVMKKEKP